MAQTTETSELPISATSLLERGLMPADDAIPFADGHKDSGVGKRLGHKSAIRRD